MMNKIKYGIIFLIIILFLNMMTIYAATEKMAQVGDTYVVKYGSSIQLNNANGNIVSSDTNIAKVTGNTVSINGNGRFTLTVKENGEEKSYNFFAWNACLKYGTFFTYKDSGGYNKTGNVLYSKTYLAVKKENSTFRINDFLFDTDGRYDGNANQLIGTYIGYFYNSSTDTSLNRYFEYSMQKNNTEYDLTTIGTEVNQNVKVTGVTLNKTSLTLNVGESDTLITSIAPSNATNKNVIWMSSNNGVATIVNGKVTALRPGIAVIIVKTIDGGKTANCRITVKSSAPTKIDVTRVTLNKTSLTLNTSESDTLIASVMPVDATNKDVTWTSSNNNVVTVVNGKVTAVKAGIAIITVRTVDGNKSANCIVIVKETGSTQIPVTGIMLNKSSISIEVGKSETLMASIIPANAANQNVTWISSNSNVVTVENGKITGVKVGIAIVSVRTVEGNKSTSCLVMVKVPTPTQIPVTGVKLNKSNMKLEVGKSETLTASITPANATNQNVTWSSSNTNIATVSKGTVKALRAGTAIVTVKTVDGNKTARCTVTVEKKQNKVFKIKLSSAKNSYELQTKDAIGKYFDKDDSKWQGTCIAGKYIVICAVNSSDTGHIYVFDKTKTNVAPKDKVVVTKHHCNSITYDSLRSRIVISAKAKAPMVYELNQKTGKLTQLAVNYTHVETSSSGGTIHPTSIAYNKSNDTFVILYSYLSKFYISSADDFYANKKSEVSYPCKQYVKTYYCQQSTINDNYWYYAITTKVNGKLVNYIYVYDLLNGGKEIQVLEETDSGKEIEGLSFDPNNGYLYFSYAIHDGNRYKKFALYKTNFLGKT